MAISKLRPATAADMVEGAAIYHLVTPESDPAVRRNWYWHVIEYVSYPNDRWKAYTAEDGCRYGLEGAYVDKEPDDSRPPTTAD